MGFLAHREPGQIPNETHSGHAMVDIFHEYEHENNTRRVHSKYQKIPGVVYPLLITKMS